MKVIKKTKVVDDIAYWDMTIPKNHNYVLANGNVVHNTGVGFSVEQKYTDQLPVISEEFHSSDTTIVVADSKLGWAKALKELIQLLYSGQIPKWDVSKVRPAGSPLKTFGGRASGPEPLVALFEFCVNIFKKAAGRKLTSLECHDIVCKIAEIVVVGGVRRSALISLSDLSDDRMRVAKSGRWWEDNVQRALANNSFVVKEEIDVGVFMKEWLSLYESKSGERGIFSRTAAKEKLMRNERRDPNHEWGVNPCGEIILRSRQFCNLTEAVVRGPDGMDELKRKVRLATILGTLQSTLTNYKYLSKKWKENSEEERLLGVSLTGIMDNGIMNGTIPLDGISLEDVLLELRETAIQTNKEWAEKIGIQQSTAITTGKPSGCTTLETEIMTEHGKMSMAEIFAEYSDENVFECNPGTWLDLKKPLKVMDENYELQNVTKLYVNGINEVYEIEDDVGNVYKFTGNHKLKTTNGWKRVDELTEKDEIIQFGNS